MIKKKGLKKKDGFSGFIEFAIISFFATIMFVAFFLTDSAMNKDMVSSSFTSNVLKEYLLRMESKGYLSPSDEMEMIQDFKQIGIVDIDTSGTTKIKPKYGSKIYLKVKGNYQSNTYEMNGWSMKEKKEKVPVKFSKSTISKS